MWNVVSADLQTTRSLRGLSEKPLPAVSPVDKFIYFIKETVFRVSLCARFKVDFEENNVLCLIVVVTTDDHRSCVEVATDTPVILYEYSYASL